MSRTINDMFNKISDKYDLLNTILSFGIHHLWKKTCVKNINLEKDKKILDCATGTGDLALKIKAYNKKSEVYALDFSSKMLSIAKKKDKKNKIIFINGDILHLPFKDNSFNAITISFGIRNVDNIYLALNEMARVTKPGGKIIILEFGQPKNFIKYFYKIYSFLFIPFIGKIISGHNNAYKYLPSTALSFPCAENFITLMNNSNLFTESSYISLSFGIAYLYIGIIK